MKKYDVRRTVQLKSPVTGAKIVEAVKKLSLETEVHMAKQYNAPDKPYTLPKFGAYREECLSDVDGQRMLLVGISSSYPYGNIAIRTGEDLSITGIQLDKTYDRIGVANTNPPMGTLVFAVGYDESSVVEAVEAVKSGLEKLL